MKCAQVVEILILAAMPGLLGWARSPAMAADSGDPSPDCNSNGIGDDSEIASGTSSDCDSNGVPDECQDRPVFTLGFRSRDRFEGDPDASLSFPVSVDLETCGLSAGEDGAQAWYFYAVISGGKPAGATTDGTVAAPEPVGLRWGGYEKTYIHVTTLCGETVESAVVLSFTKNITLPPEKSPHEVLRFRVEARFPPTGSAACGLEVMDHCGYEVQGGAGSGWGVGQPVGSSVTWRGTTVTPILGSKTVELVTLANDFRRGDTNGDGRVDISDAIKTFMFLFLDGQAPGCLDAADSTDDATIDISDGIRILSDFFIPETAIPDPGPFHCGLDPTRDALGCGAYDTCS